MNPDAVPAGTDESYELAYRAADYFMAAGYPGVPLVHDPDAYVGACRQAVRDHAVKIVSDALEIVITDDVLGRIDDGVAQAEEDADDRARTIHVIRPRYEQSVTPRTPPACGHRTAPISHRGRARQSRPGISRRRGSRRGTGKTGSRDGPSDLADEPPSSRRLPIGGRR